MRDRGSRGDWRGKGIVLAWRRRTESLRRRKSGCLAAVRRRALYTAAIQAGRSGSRCRLVDFSETALESSNLGLEGSDFATADGLAALLLGVKVAGDRVKALPGASSGRRTGCADRLSAVACVWGQGQYACPRTARRNSRDIRTSVSGRADWSWSAPSKGSAKTKLNALDFAFPAAPTRLWVCSQSAYHSLALARAARTLPRPRLAVDLAGGDEVAVAVGESYGPESTLEGAVRSGGMLSSPSLPGCT